jgi:hypothetical protein
MVGVELSILRKNYLNNPEGALQAPTRVYRKSVLLNRRQYFDSGVLFP